MRLEEPKPHRCGINQLEKFMGLDMYLTGKRYLGRRDQEAVDAIGEMNIGAHGMKPIRVECEAMYWRKANAIHGWFVENVQHGKDDCGEYEVPIDDLKTLADACKEALANMDKADEIFPPRSGFFFGTAEKDDWYWNSLQATVDGITKILANPDLSKWDFYYQSSW
jgi:hypothetical protein